MYKSVSMSDWVVTETDLYNVSKHYTSPYNINMKLFTIYLLDIVNSYSRLNWCTCDCWKNTHIFYSYRAIKIAYTKCRTPYHDFHEFICLTFFKEQEIQNQEAGTGKRYLKNLQKKISVFWESWWKYVFSDSERE